MRLFLTGIVLVPGGFVRDAASVVSLFCGFCFEYKALGGIDVAQLAADVGKAALHGYGSASFGKLWQCAIEHLADCCFEAVQVIGFIDRFLILQPAVIDRNIPELYRIPLVRHLKNYYNIGGIPEVVQGWNENHDYAEAEKFQDRILHDYPGTFDKYTLSKNRYGHF